MATKNISLPDELDSFIERKVASGEYAHASEVVRDAVRLLMQEDADKLELLREAIADGITSAARRRIPDSRIAAEIRKRSQKRHKSRRGAA